ncbi:F-box and leucine-rich protein 22 [Engraulis encrasicolus]|uniref:F-box and leucine-rich protein 22 n=1 Tax=Engraulis encrasicolus TaxID=184585 RepID=UPI002FCF2BF7
MHLTELNTECLLHLLSFLDKDSRRSLSLTCRRLCEAYLEPGLWTLLRFGSPGELRRDNFVLGAALRHLAICWHSSRVKVCNVEDWMKTSFQKDLCREHEGLVSQFLERVCHTCPNLLSLTLSGCGHISDGDVVGVLRSCVRLRQLRLENCSRVTDTLLQAAALHGQSLEEVRVDFCRNVTRSGLQALRERRPDLLLGAERSAGMIPDTRPEDRPQARRALQKVLLFV